jgi:hypothetical protein
MEQQLHTTPAQARRNTSARIGDYSVAAPLVFGHWRSFGDELRRLRADDHNGRANREGKRLVDGQNFTLTLLKSRRNLRRRDGGELKRGQSWR